MTSWRRSGVNYLALSFVERQILNFKLSVKYSWKNNKPPIKILIPLLKGKFFNKKAYGVSEKLVVILWKSKFKYNNNIQVKKILNENKKYLIDEFTIFEKGISISITLFSNDVLFLFQSVTVLSYWIHLYSKFYK